MHFSFSRGILSLQTWPMRNEQEILRKYKLTRLIKMSSNENCYGPSSKIQEAIGKVLPNRYPDVHAMPLKLALSEKLGVSADQILVGNGSSEVIQMIAATFLQPSTDCM